MFSRPPSSRPGSAPSSQHSQSSTPSSQPSRLAQAEHVSLSTTQPHPTTADHATSSTAQPHQTVDEATLSTASHAQTADDATASTAPVRTKAANRFSNALTPLIVPDPLSLQSSPSQPSTSTHQPDSSRSFIKQSSNRPSSAPSQPSRLSQQHSIKSANGVTSPVRAILKQQDRAAVSQRVAMHVQFQNRQLPQQVSKPSTSRNGSSPSTPGTKQQFRRSTGAIMQTSFPRLPFDQDELCQQQKQAQAEQRSRCVVLLLCVCVCVSCTLNIPDHLCPHQQTISVFTLNNTHDPSPRHCSQTCVCATRVS